ncbi:hypothetical protein Tco_1109074 [Tanacetum coccineum]
MKTNHNLYQLQCQLGSKYLHLSNPKSCPDELITPFKNFFDSKEVNALDFHNKSRQKHCRDYTRHGRETYRQDLLRYLNDLIKLIDERLLKYGELQMKESEGTTLEACLVTEGVVMNDNLVAQQCTVDSSTLSKQHNECNGLVEQQNDNLVSSCSNVEKQNMQQLQLQARSQKEMSIKWFKVLQGNTSFLLREYFISLNNIDEGAFERAFLKLFETMIRDIVAIKKYLVEAILHEHEIQKRLELQSNDVQFSLVQALEASLVVMKSSGIDSSERNDANTNIGPSYDSDTVTKTGQTLRMLLPKEDNMYTGKQAEKRLKVKQRKSPLSYHGFVYGDTQFKEPPKVPLKRRDVNLKKHLEQAQLSKYDPTLWKSLLMKYFCYVKHAMLKFEKEIVSKQNPPREAVYINSSFEDNVKRIARNQLFEEFKPLVKHINLQLNHFKKGLVKEMKDDFKYVTSLEDEFDEKCLILDIQQEFFKT